MLRFANWLFSDTKRGGEGPPNNKEGKFYLDSFKASYNNHR